MRLTIAYSKMKKRNLVLINNATYQRETLSEQPIRPPLNHWSFEYQGNKECQFRNFVILPTGSQSLATFLFNKQTDKQTKSKTKQIPDQMLHKLDSFVTEPVYVEMHLDFRHQYQMWLKCWSNFAKTKRHKCKWS